MKSLHDVLKEEKPVKGEEFLEQVKKQSAKAKEFWDKQYQVAERDTKAIDGEIDAAFIADERTKLKLNKLRQFVNRVVGDQRQNVHSIEVIPTRQDSKTPNKIASATNQNKTYSYTDVIEGLIRNIEYTSKAQDHYKYAFKQALEGGIGWLRVYYTYAREDSFDMDIKIKSIPYRSSVYIDPTAIEPDFSDINYAFVFTRMDKEAFKQKYPKASLEGSGIDDTGLWEDDEKVTVAEYFRREPYRDKIYLLNTGEVVKASEVENVLDDLAAKGIEVVNEREVILYRIKWYLMTANEILEETIFPGDTIPIVPVLGREIIVDKRRWFRSLVYDALDAQKMHNTWFTSATEKMALSPLSPWVAPDEVIAPYKTTWKNANKQPYSYLPYKFVEGRPAPQRNAPTALPAAELQVAMYSIDEIKSSIGMYDASLGQISNETSGRAIIARQKQADIGTYEFLDNLDMAIARIGRIIVDLIPYIYDTQRLLRIRFPDGSGDFVEINKEVMDLETGEKVKVHDLSIQKYDVIVSTGASYHTKREEASDKIMNLMKVLPQVGQVAPDLIVANLDIPHAKELSKRLKKTVPPDLLSPEDLDEEQQQVNQEAMQAQQQQMAMQQQLEQQQAEMERQIKQAELEKKALEVEKEKLDLEQERVKLEQDKVKLQELQQKTFDNVNQTGYNENMEEHIRELVAQALAEYIKQTQGGNYE